MNSEVTKVKHYILSSWRQLYLYTLPLIFMHINPISNLIQLQFNILSAQEIEKYNIWYKKLSVMHFSFQKFIYLIYIKCDNPSFLSGAFPTFLMFLVFYFSTDKCISPNIKIKAIVFFPLVLRVWKKDTKTAGLEKRYPGGNYFYNSQIFCDSSVVKASKIMVKYIYYIYIYI